MNDYNKKLNLPRNLSIKELDVINKMLSVEFDGKDLICKQLETAKVISYCSCGCKTVNIQVDDNTPRYKDNKRVPVELRCVSNDGIPVIMAIHMIDGYLGELEIYRVDSKAINEDIDIKNSIIIIN